MDFALNCLCRYDFCGLDVNPYNATISTSIRGIGVKKN